MCGEQAKLMKLLRRRAEAAKLMVDRECELLGFLLGLWLETRMKPVTLPAAPTEKLLTIKEAAQFLNVTPRTIQNYKRKGKLQPRYVNKEPRFERQELEAWTRRKELQE